MGQEEDLDAVDRIYQALDNDDPEQALGIALDQISRSGPDDPVLQFFAGKSWVECGEPSRALPFLRRAAELDPDDLEFRSELGFALLESGLAAEAAEQADRLLESDPAFADGHWLQGLVLEAGGSPGEADRKYDEAARLDPERYPKVERIPSDRFEALVHRAALRLPEMFREHLERVATLVEPLVPAALREEGIPPLDTLGLFTGTTLDLQGAAGVPVDVPPCILLFQRNLERYAALENDLETQIAVTLYHELGHYLGMDEDDLDEAGFR